MPRAALLALGLALLLSPPAAGGEAPGEPSAPPGPPGPFATEAELVGKPIAEVAVEGLVTVKPEEVRKAMATRVGLPYHPATYREDCTRLYALGFFKIVTMERPQLTASGGVRAIVRLEERPIVDAVELSGNRKVSTSSLLEAARGEKDKSKEGWKPRPILTAGGRFDENLAEQMRQAFLRLYTEKRFPPAPVDERGEPIPGRPGLTIRSRTEPVEGRPGHVKAVFEITEDRPVIITDRVVFVEVARDPLKPGEYVAVTNPPEPFKPALPVRGLLKPIRSRPAFWPASWLLPYNGYDPETHKLDALRIQETYRNNGYSDARVTAPAPRVSEPLGLRNRRRATVTFEVREGQRYVYGWVNFEGLSLVSDEEVRRRAGLSANREPTEDQLGRAARELKLLRETEFLRCVEQGSASFLKPIWSEPVHGALHPEYGSELDRGIRLGSPYSDLAVDLARRRIVRLLGEYGRPFAQVDVRRQEPDEDGKAAVLKLLREAKVLQRAGIKTEKAYSGKGVRDEAGNLDRLLLERGQSADPDERPAQDRPPEPGVSVVRFMVSAGPEATVGEVRIKGNVQTQDRVIRRQLEVFPGDIYDSRRVAQSERNLRRRSLFEKVSIRAVPGEEPDITDIEVEVKEQQTGLFNIGASASPDDGSVGGRAELSYRNFDWRSPPRSWSDFPGFRGGDQTLSLSAYLSEKSQSYGLEHYNPWIWDTPEHYYLRSKLFHEFLEYEDFDKQSTGASLTLGRRLFHRWLRGYAKYTVKNVYISEVDSEAPDVLRDEEGYTLFSSGTVGLVFDTLNDQYVPTSGVLLEASEEVFGGVFGGDHDIRKTELEGNGFLPLFHTWGYAHVLHLRAKADWANAYGRDDYVPPSERYYAGGIGTVRGYETRTITPRIGDYAVGGDFRMVESVEYIFPLFEDIFRGVLFFDAGNVWEDEGDFELHDQRRSVGAGILIHVTPLGPHPIKLYFSKALNPREDEDTQVFQLSFSILF